MGDSSNQAICERFIEEFEKDLKPLLELKGDNLMNQGLEVDDDFNVRWMVTYHAIQSGPGLLTPPRIMPGVDLMGCEVIFNCNMEADDTVDYLCGALYESEPTEEEIAAIRERVEGVFS